MKQDLEIYEEMTEVMILFLYLKKCSPFPKYLLFWLWTLDWANCRDDFCSCTRLPSKLGHPCSIISFCVSVDGDGRSIRSCLTLLVSMKSIRLVGVWHPWQSNDVSGIKEQLLRKKNSKYFSFNIFLNVLTPSLFCLQNMGNNIYLFSRNCQFLLCYF